MKILTATPHFYRPICRLFPDHDVEVLGSYDKNTSADLLVFTGGEDVHPSRYHKSAPKSGDFNPERDEWEFKVLKDVRNNTLKVKKVFGICRGLQLLNVGFGGTLVYDIHQRFGEEHNYTHPLVWLPAQLSRVFAPLFPEVNSLHHQGIESVGCEIRPITFAVEPNTSITEVIMWGDKYLAVQFHPELMYRNESVAKFVNWIEKWVEGGDEQSSSKKTSYKISFTGGTSTNF